MLYIASRSLVQSGWHPQVTKSMWNIFTVSIKLIFNNSNKSKENKIIIKVLFDNIHQCQSSAIINRDDKSIAP